MEEINKIEKAILFCENKINNHTTNQIHIKEYENIVNWLKQLLIVKTNIL